MGAIFLMLTEMDRLCGQLSAAIHRVELPLYATLALAVIVSVIVFPPRDDLDQA
ncbi:MAG: hypothetical protein KGK33_05670 [Hyphomicrobiales bacterium]|nr:hypothetical protein [Hyphomicrobiales bacterium]